MELLEELDGAAARTAEAQRIYIEKCGQELAAKQLLEDYEKEVKAEAADKSLHKELTNDDVRGGFFIEKMSSGLGLAYREAQGRAWQEKMDALRKYDFARRREVDLRSMVDALSAGRE